MGVFFQAGEDFSNLNNSILDCLNYGGKVCLRFSRVQFETLPHLIEIVAHRYVSVRKIYWILNQIISWNQNQNIYFAVLPRTYMHVDFHEIFGRGVDRVFPWVKKWIFNPNVINGLFLCNAVSWNLPRHVLYSIEIWK